MRKITGGAGRLSALKHQPVSTNLNGHNTNQPSCSNFTFGEFKLKALSKWAYRIFCTTGTLVRDKNTVM